MRVTVAKTNAEIKDCWAVMVQLRPHLKVEDFVAAVRGQLKEGYRLVFIRRGRKVVAVAGFRIQHCLAWGRFCYVDGLVTDERARSKGLGAALLEWVGKQAKAEGCQRLELDSGVQRFAAHRFSFAQRMSIRFYHFSRELSGTGKRISVR